ncbi:MAG: hypothetical protein JST54_15630 [Deltaproteobacteria bacterium]|nr:hypothetical protein [Deltaproteobacteria bacterium]
MIATNNPDGLAELLSERASLEYELQAARSQLSWLRSELRTLERVAATRGGVASKLWWIGGALAIALLIAWEIR